MLKCLILIAIALCLIFTGGAILFFVFSQFNCPEIPDPQQLSKNHLLLLENAFLTGSLTGAKMMEAGVISNPTGKDYERIVNENWRIYLKELQRLGFYFEKEK